MSAISFECLPQGMGNLIGVFEAYFDESGTGDELLPCCSVAGWMGEREQWVHFEREWSEALLYFGVSSLHMRDFAHSRGEFASWKGQEVRRKEFLARLVGIISRRVRRGFGATIYLDAYRNAVSGLSRPARFKTPYAVCALAGMRMIHSWAEEYGIPKDSFSCFYESGSKCAKPPFRSISALNADTSVVSARQADFNPTACRPLLSEIKFETFAGSEIPILAQI